MGPPRTLAGHDEIGEEGEEPAGAGDGTPTALTIGVSNSHMTWKRRLKSAVANR